MRPRDYVSIVHVTGIGLVTCDQIYQLFTKACVWIVLVTCGHLPHAARILCACDTDIVFLATCGLLPHAARKCQACGAGCVEAACLPSAEGKFLMKFFDRPFHIVHII